MTPQPKLSEEQPYRWLPCVLLTPDDVKEFLKVLPRGSYLAEGLQEASLAAKERTEQLNKIEQGRAS